MRIVAVTVAWLCLVAGVAGAQDGGVDPDAAPPPQVDAGPIIVDGPDLLGLARPQVNAAAAPSVLRLGDTLTLFVEVVYDEKVTVSLPATLDLAPDFEETRRTSNDERRTDGTRKRVYQVQLRAWELGDLRIPPIQVGYTASGQQSWVVTNSVPIEVTGWYSDVDDKTLLNPDAAPVDLRRRDYRLPLLGLGVATIAIVAFVVWRLARRKKPTFQVVPESPAPTVVRARLTGPAERALAALEALDRKGTLVSDPRAGYDELVGILRTFASEQYGVPILDRTTDELLGSLRERMSPPVWTKARRWFARCDLVKYAAERPAADGSVRDLRGAREVITGAAGG
jgi:hypothetical protein